ncbi:MAG: hypothetical protein OSB44_00990 [Verrucomicrobiales bacterium]|nr:hypothetical protein [Verrucomicrobiales bacterium]
MNKKSFIILIVTAVLSIAFKSQAKEIPFPLPNHDGLPGDSSKPVKVYILAGQSNMVGMGNLSGAKNIYDGVFLSSDPNVPDSPLQIFKVGNYKTSPLAVFNSEGQTVTKQISRGQFEVSLNGIYHLNCGFGDNSYCFMQIDGKEVYRRELGGKPVKQAITLQSGKRYNFKISGFEGVPPRFWMQKTDLLGNGDLEAVVKREGNFPWLLDAESEWTVRQDVYFQEARLAKDGKGSPLSATSNGKSIGPELGFGHVLGTFHGEQVLLIKTAQGNRSLGFDFRPPSSGRTDPDNQFESAEYKLMIEGVRKTLNNIAKVVPDYKNQGYEIAGFVWFQGHKDSFTEVLIEEYEKHLANLINDVRKEFDTPKLPVVVATIGFGGHNMQEKFLNIHQAQMAISDTKKHPEYAGTVASVDTRDFWREVDESPKGEDYHYNRNAETYMLIGDALGRAMVRLLGGKAEPLPLAPRPKRGIVEKGNELSEEKKSATQKALKSIILDGIVAAYVANPRYSKVLLQEASSERPQRENQFLRGVMYGLENCYRAAGLDDYDWRSFGPDFNEVQWSYYSFDPKEILPKEKGSRYRKVTYPTGMEIWNMPKFDAGKADWKKGLQPFGQLDGKLVPLLETCTATFCRCSERPQTLWEKEVLLVRATVELPPLKKDHRYRIVVGGSAHVNSGEGYAIYLNGKLLGKSETGVAVRQGGQPRGCYIYSDLRDEIKGGKVTLAVTSFLRYNHPRRGLQPPRGHLSLQIEEQKLPSLK